MSECACGNGRRTAEWFIQASGLLSVLVLIAQIASLLIYGATHSFAPVFVALIIALGACCAACLWLAGRGPYVKAMVICSWASLTCIGGMAAIDAVRHLRGDAGASDFPYMIMLLTIAIPARWIVSGGRSVIPYVAAFCIGCLGLACLYGNINGAATGLFLALAGVGIGREFRRQALELCKMHRWKAKVNEALEAMNGRHA